MPILSRSALVALGAALVALALLLTSEGPFDTVRERAFDGFLGVTRGRTRLGPVRSRRWSSTSIAVRWQRSAPGRGVGGQRAYRMIAFFPLPHKGEQRVSGKALLG